MIKNMSFFYALTFIFLLLPTIVDARNLIEMEQRTTKGCRVVFYVETSKSRIEMKSLEWSGECKNGFSEGRGTLIAKYTNKDSAKVVANFKRGRKEGPGTVEEVFAEGGKIFFRGNFTNGLKQGNGEQVLDNALGYSYHYKGNFVDGSPEGNGRMETEDWNYIGEFQGKFQPSGTGRFDFYRNKTRYEGDVRDGKPNGMGKLSSPAGATISGYFVNGESPAAGRIDYPDGGVYEGELRSGQPHGKGRATYPDRTVYVGRFLNGNPHGEGDTQSAVEQRRNANSNKENEVQRSSEVRDNRRRSEEANEQQIAACQAAMIMRPTRGGSYGEALQAASQCNADPNAHQRPLPPSYSCRRDHMGNINCASY